MDEELAALKSAPAQARYPVLPNERKMPSGASEPWSVTWASCFARPKRPLRKEWTSKPRSVPYAQGERSSGSFSTTTTATTSPSAFKELEWGTMRQLLLTAVLVGLTQLGAVTRALADDD